MEINPYQGQQQEIYKMVRENNKMLHAMRRNAFWGGLVKFLIYALLLLGPLWFYMTYVNPSVQQVLQTVNKVQGVGVEAGTQMGGFRDQLEEIVGKLSSFLRSPSSTQATSTPE